MVFPFLTTSKYHFTQQNLVSHTHRAFAQAAESNTQATQQTSPPEEAPKTTSLLGGLVPMSFRWFPLVNEPRKTIGNHRKTMGKWWFSGILWDLPSGYVKITMENHHV